MDEMSREDQKRCNQREKRHARNGLEFYARVLEFELADLKRAPEELHCDAHLNQLREAIHVDAWAQYLRRVAGEPSLSPMAAEIEAGQDPDEIGADYGSSRAIHDAMRAFYERCVIKKDPKAGPPPKASKSRSASGDSAPRAFAGLRRHR